MFPAGRGRNVAGRSLSQVAAGRASTPRPPPQRGHNAVDWWSSSRAKLCFCLPGWFDSDVQGSRFCSELPGAYEEDASMDDELTGFILFCLITGLSPPPMRSA